MQLVLFAFIAIPIIEMVVLIEVGSIVGVLNTILLVLLTAVIGVSLLKKQGLATLMTANQKMQTGQMPVSEIAQGLMLAVAGALLLTPGFVTDTIGFLLLTPAVRLWLARKVGQALVQRGNVYYQQSNFTYQQHESHRSEDIIDGEYQDLTPNKDRLDKQ